MRAQFRRMNGKAAGLTLVVLLAFSALAMSGFDGIELLTYDARVRMANRFSNPERQISPRLAVLFYDDLALSKVREGAWVTNFAAEKVRTGSTNLPAQIGGENAPEEEMQIGWPWPRFIHGQVVRELTAQGASAIGFDILFLDSDGGAVEYRVATGEPVSRPEEEAIVLETSGRVALTSDEFFAKAMKESGRTWLAAMEEAVPLELFLEGAAGLAAIELILDQPVLRRVKPYQEIRIWHPALRDPEDQGPQTERPFVTRRVWNLGLILGAQALQLNLDQAEISNHEIVLRGPNEVERRIPLDDEGFVYIDWTASHADVIAGKTPILSGSLGEILRSDARRSKGGEDPAAPFNNRSVLIGVTASGHKVITDSGSTPLDPQTPAAMLHVNLANSVLMNRWVRKSGLLENLLYIAWMGAAGAFLAARLSPIKASASVVLLSGCYTAGAIAVFVWWRYWMPIGLPIGCALVASHVGMIVNRSDPLSIAKRFFSGAGFRKVEALSSDLLLLHGKEGEAPGLAVLWKANPDLTARLETAMAALRKKQARPARVYLLYHDESPASRVVQDWRERFNCEFVPLLDAMLKKALAQPNYERELRLMEEPYLVRADPYAEFKPISDPTWFYGRDELLERLPAALAQGQHVAIFGLRKVGKTSLTNQLRQRFVATPAAFIDCQGLSAKAETYLDAIYREWHGSLEARGVKHLPKIARLTEAEQFAERTVELFRLWQADGGQEPFIIFLDEMDKFFPNPEIQGREPVLAEYAKLFRVLRALAQSHRCLVTCVIAYRPAVNRQNLLAPSVGENPMFSSFQEVYLGFLTPAESAAMLREIGLWKNIVWEESAAGRVFEYCGGHPLITRYFASHACRKGTLKQVNEGRVLETAEELKKTLRKNEIGNYYKEAIGDLLSAEEKQMLNLIVQARPPGGMPESAVPTGLEDALSNLENFGLVENAGGALRVPAQLFRAWLERRVARPEPAVEWQ